MAVRWVPIPPRSLPFPLFRAMATSNAHRLFYVGLCLHGPSRPLVWIINVRCLLVECPPSLPLAFCGIERRSGVGQALTIHWVPSIQGLSRSESVGQTDCSLYHGKEQREREAGMTVLWNGD